VRRLASVIATILLLVGCSARPGTSGAPPQASPLTSASAPPSGRFAGAHLDHAGAAVLVVTPDAVYADAGARRVAITAGGPPQRQAISGADAQHLIYAAVLDASIIALRSSDGGASWAAAGKTSISGALPVAAVGVAAVGDGFAVLANDDTSVTSSSGSVAVGGSKTGSLVLRAAPVGGSVWAAGKAYWLTGGVMGDQVFASRDGSQWDAVKLPAPSKYWTAGEPVDVDSVGVVLPVTSNVPDGGASIVTFLATTDLGGTWHEVGTTAAPHTEFNTTAAVAVTQDGHWIVVWADASKVIVGAFGSSDTKAFLPNGLAPNVGEVAFSSATDGMAISTPDSCPNGKESCTSSTVLSRTVDGGQTWAEVK
jgi:hypothetical protein